jgi:hypothetical protein
MKLTVNRVARSLGGFQVQATDRTGAELSAVGGIVALRPALSREPSHFGRGVPSSARIPPTGAAFRGESSGAHFPLITLSPSSWLVLLPPLVSLFWIFSITNHDFESDTRHPTNANCQPPSSIFYYQRVDVVGRKQPLARHPLLSGRLGPRGVPTRSLGPTRCVAFRRASWLYSPLQLPAW